MKRSFWNWLLVACVCVPGFSPAHAQLTTGNRTGNRIWPSGYTDTFTYNCPKAAFTLRRTFDRVHRLVSVEQIISNRAYPSPELKDQLESLGNWRLTFMEGTDCRDEADGPALEIHAVQLAKPTRPQAEVKGVYFSLRASGRVTIEDSPIKRSNP